MELLAGAYMKKGDIHEGEEEAKVSFTIILIIAHMNHLL